MEEFEALRFMRPENLSTEQRTVMRAIRDQVGTPAASTPMQKILDGGDLDSFIDNNYRPQGFCATQADAGTNVFHNSDEMVEGLRLDHLENPKTVGVVEWNLQNTSDVRIPYGPGHSGDVAQPYPFVGGGLVASRVGRVTPELFSESEISLNIGASAYRLNAQGQKTLVAVWNGTQWVRQ